MIIPTHDPVTSPTHLPDSGFGIDPDFEQYLHAVRRKLEKLEVQQVAVRLLAIDYPPEVTGVFFHIVRVTDAVLSRLSTRRVDGTPWKMGVGVSVAHREDGAGLTTFENLQALLENALQQFPHAGDFLESLQSFLPQGGFVRETLLTALTLAYDQRYGNGAWHKDFSRHERTLLQTRLAVGVQALPDVSRRL